MMEKATLTRGDITLYIKKHKIFKNFSVRELKAGLANRNYLISSGGQKYNLRTNRLRPPMHTENLRNEHLVLEFLKTEKTPFVSESIYYDEVENIHIVKFVPGQKIQIKNLKNDNLETVIKYLYQINILAGKFDSFLKKKKIKFASPRRYNHNLVKRLAPKIKFLIKDKIYYEYISWVEKRLKDDLGLLPIEEKEIYLNHGDPVSNIIINGHKLYLIDWEQVSFSYDAGLANIYTHGFLSREMKKDIVNIYAKLAGLDPSWLREQTIKKYKQMLLEHTVLLCRIHARNRRLYQNPAPLDEGFIRDRQQRYKNII